VTLLVRGNSLPTNMSEYLVRQIEHLSNIEVRLNTEVIDAEGESLLQKITLLDRLRGTTRSVPAEMLFVLVGADPHTEWLANCVARDAQGFVLSGKELEQTGLRWNAERPPLRYESSMEGVFVAGDVRSGSVKRVASAVGEGAVAVAF